MVATLDGNSDRLGVAVVSPQGNLLARRTVWMQGVEDARSDKAEHIVPKALEKALYIIPDVSPRLGV